MGEEGREKVWGGGLGEERGEEKVCGKGWSGGEGELVKGKEKSKYKDLKDFRRGG